MKDSGRGVFAGMISKPAKADGFYFGTEDVFDMKGTDEAYSHFR